MKNVYFRASGIGALMTSARGQVLTDNQKQKLSEYKERANGNGKPLTDNQKKEFDDLLQRENAKPQLSETAKQFVKRTWLQNEKGFYEEFGSKYTEKGLLNEDNGIVLVSELESNNFVKNTERKYKGNITGECDVIFKSNGNTIVKDIKNNWNALTFMNGDLSTLYEWQGRAYMHLYDADEFHLHYTLTDCPYHLFEAEKRKLWYKYYDPGMSNEQEYELEKKLQPYYEQLERNLFYENNPFYTKEERLKTFKIERCLQKENELLEAVNLALEYYKSLTLNII